MASLTEASLYSTLPKFVTEKSDQLGIKVPEKTENKFVKSFLKNHVRSDLLGKERSNIPNEFSSQVLDPVKLKKPKEPAKRKMKKKHFSMGAADKKKYKVYDIKPEHQKYEMYEMMHSLWKDYMSDLVDFTRPGMVQSTFTQMKLLKADYHGAIIHVVKSKTPSLVGVEGIVVQETKNVFKIITKEDRLKTIPKRKTVFCVEVEGYRVTLYGDNWTHRAAERAHKKYRMPEDRLSLDL